MHDKQGGLPSFLRNNFVGNASQQLLIGLELASILTQEEIKEALHLSQLIQVSTPKLWRRLWYGKPSYVEQISSVCYTIACCYSGQDPYKWTRYDNVGAGDKISFRENS